MLSDLEIEAAYRKMIDRIDLVNDDYLKRVAEQIKKIGQLNPSSIHKLSQMRMYRGNIQQIRRELAEALNISAGELQQLLERAAQEQYNDANFSAVVQNKRRQPLRYSEELKTYITAVARQTAERFANYSNTTVIDQNYQETVTNAIDAVTRGVTDYNSAIRDSMRKLGGDGLRVEYDSGVTRRMDTAIRQNVIDGVKQIQQEAARQAGEQMGADGVELSAHPFSAVDHEPAQGRMYTNAEFEKMQSGQPFEDVDGKHYDGFERPIAEWNCRHFASPVIIGVSPRRYTDEQLEAWKKKNHAGCDIGGKHYTVYEAGQLMRKIETKIRQQKDIANLAKRSGDNVLKREAQAKTVDLRAQYNVVAEAAGLKPRPERAIVESYTAHDADLRQYQSQVSPPKEYDGVFDEYDFEPLDLSKTEASALNELHMLSQENGYEYSCMIADGKVGRIETAKKIDRCPTPEGALNGKNVTVLHSHTNDTAFSRADLEILCHDSIDKMLLIAHNRDVYEVSIGNGERPSAQEYEIAQDEAERQANENMMGMPDFYDWTMSERSYMAIKEQMLLLARYFKWTVKGGRI